MYLNTFYINIFNMVPNYNTPRSTTDDDDMQSQLLIQYIGQYLNIENNIRRLTEESRETHNNIHNLLQSGRRSARFSNNLLVIQALLADVLNDPDESAQNSNTPLRTVRQYRPTNLFSPSPRHSAVRPSEDIFFLNRLRTGQGPTSHNENVGAEFIAEFLNSSVPIHPSREELTRASAIEQFSNIAEPLNTRCPISLDVFTSTDMVVRLVRCGHLFSPTSFNEWFRNHVHCPVCRNDIRPNTTSPMPHSESEHDNQAGNIINANNNPNVHINTSSIEQLASDINDISNLMQINVGRRHLPQT